MIAKLLNAFLAAIVVFQLSPQCAWGKGLSVSSMTGASGTKYHFYEKNDLDIAWDIKRPEKRNERIKLCIPAAFTTTTGTVVGIYAVRGKVGNAKRISKPIGGAILIRDGKFTIFPSSKGSAFTSDFISSLERDKASLFQQYQIVTKGVPAGFKDKNIFQMRGIVKFADGREGVIESVDAVSFKVFNSDLAKLGVEDALYTDMGAWDEGWYRDPKTASIVPIGNDRSLTHKQTNWVTFVEKN